MATYINANSVAFSNNTFENNKNIVNVDLRNTAFVNDLMHSAFYNCTNLKSIGMRGFTRSINIIQSQLGHDALVAFLNQAGTAYNSSQKITMGSAKLALLSDEEKAIATNKGWQLA